jgi:hypothetical protein
MVPFRGPQHNPAPSERAASSALRGATGAAADAGQQHAALLQGIVGPRLPLRVPAGRGCLSVYMSPKAVVGDSMQSAT